MGPSINDVRTWEGWGGQHQCIQMRTRGEGGSELDKSTHFVHMFIENATISESFNYGDGTMTTTATIYISYESSYFSVCPCMVYNIRICIMKTTKL